MRRAVALAGLVAAVGCKKATPDAAEVGSLWKFAPAGATVGVVLSPRAMAAIDGTASAVYQALGSVPDLAGLNTMVTGEAQRRLGTPHPHLADLSIRTDRSAAVFTLADSHEVVVVLPVSNHARFHRASTLSCKTRQDYEVCAKPAALLDQVGKGHLAPPAERGDVEVRANGNFEGKQLDITAVARLSSGAFDVNGTIDGLPAQDLAMIGEGGKARVDSTTAGFALFDMRPFLLQDASDVILPGITRRDIMQTIAGPLTATITGDATGEARMTLSDPKPMQTVLERCGEMDATMSFSDGVCHATIPPLGIVINAWVDGKELHVGKKATPAGTGGGLTNTGKQLASTPWAFALYGRGSLIGMPSIPSMSVIPLTDYLVGAVYAAALINELGIGVRREGSTVRYTMTVRTVFANPDDVVKKLLAIPPRDIASGKSVDAAKQIADAAPHSPFADDLHAGYGGMVLPGLAIAAVSLAAKQDRDGAAPSPPPTAQAPAPTGGATIGASAILEKIDVGARASAAAKGAFPKGSITTPGHACCGQPQNKCAPNAADWKNPLWHALSFSIDQPTSYQVGYSSKDGKTFQAVAIGDLDCDGTAATWVLDGVIGPNGKVDTRVTAPMKGVY